MNNEPILLILHSFYILSNDDCTTTTTTANTDNDKVIYIYIYIYILHMYPYLPTSSLEQDMTQGQFLSGV